MDKLGDLEVFAQVVASGSLSAAGRELGMSPAVVSKRLRRLEERIGTRLLQRTTRQISLTEAGQGYYDRVTGVLAGLDEAEAFVTRRSRQARGVLKISAPTTFGRMHIAPHLRTFMNANPDLSINLTITDQMTDIVADGFDVAIRVAALEDSSLVARRLAPVQRLLCASPAYLKTHGVPNTIKDLENHNCLPPHNNDPWNLHGPDGPFQYRATGRMQTNSSEVVRESVIAGLGIALRSTWDIYKELQAGKLVRVLPHIGGSRDVAIYAIYASRDFLPTKIRVFVDFLAELYSPRPYWDARHDAKVPNASGNEIKSTHEESKHA